MGQSQQPNHIRHDDVSSELFPAFASVQSRLGNFVPVNPLNISIHFAFSVAFAQMFLSDTPNYEIKKGSFGATRSSWTYHTALAIAQTCKMLNLTCRFEALGKRDAVIETKDDTPDVILIAEWEWDYEDVFGKGKELDKLKTSCKSSRTAEAFLLTYCPSTKYPDYLQRVAEYWISAVKSIKVPPALFLHTIVFEEQAGHREFIRLRTSEISPLGIFLWNDQYF